MQKSTVFETIPIVAIKYGNGLSIKSEKSKTYQINNANSYLIQGLCMQLPMLDNSYIDPNSWSIVGWKVSLDKGGSI